MSEVVQAQVIMRACGHEQQFILLADDPHAEARLAKWKSRPCSACSAAKVDAIKEAAKQRKAERASTHAALMAATRKKSGPPPQWRREQMAVRIAAGLAANPNFTASLVADLAVAITDEILEKLNGTRATNLVPPPN